MLKEVSLRSKCFFHVRSVWEHKHKGKETQHHADKRLYNMIQAMDKPTNEDPFVMKYADSVWWSQVLEIGLICTTSIRSPVS